MISQKHSEAARRNGKLYGGAKQKPLSDAVAAFWKRGRLAPNGCIEWTGATVNGYGSLCFQGKHTTAHRVAFVLEKHEIPDGLWVLHKCDNRLCINPAHLFLGTCKDNNNDCVRKGRNSPPPRQKEWLTPEQRLAVRLEFLPFKRSAPFLASKYGVPINAIKYAIYPRQRLLAMYSELGDNRKESRTGTSSSDD